MNPQHQVLIVQLRDHLDAELVLHRRLLASAEEKITRVVAHDIPAFTTCLEREQGLAADMGRLRQVRERLLRALAAVLAIPGDQLTLSAVIARAEPVRQGELAQRQRDLRQLLERLRVANERCLLLVRSGLSLVRDVLQAVMGEEAGGQRAYDRRGASGGSAPWRGRLVNLAG